MDSLDKDFLKAVAFTALSESKFENIESFSDKVDEVYKKLREIRKSNRKPGQFKTFRDGL